MPSEITEGELIDRYVHAVLSRVPRSRRQEVAGQLRARIEGATASQDVRAALSELGPPEDLARVYRGAPRELIGPRLYDTYLRVLWPAIGAVALVLGGLRLLGALVEATENRTDSLSAVEVLWRAISAMLTAGVYAAFCVTVVFAIIERTSVAPEFSSWEPDDLPAVPVGQEISVGEAVAELVFAVVVLIGAASLSPSVAPPFLADVHEALDPSFIDRLVPVMIVVAALWVIAAAVALLVRRWTLLVTATSVISDLLAIVAGAVVSAHRPHFSSGFLTDLYKRTGSDLESQLDLAVGVICILVMLASAAGIVTAVRKYLVHRRG